ncbi:hypothetical protein D3C85_1570980 [compost metagenome]
MCFQLSLPGRIRFKPIATTAHSAIPLRPKSSGPVPVPISTPPIPNTRVTDTITRLRASPRSILWRISVFIPTAAIEPNNRHRIPPITGTGMLCSSAPNLPMNARLMAKIAAQVMIFGL